MSVKLGPPKEHDGSREGKKKSNDTITLVEVRREIYIKFEKDTRDDTNFAGPSETHKRTCTSKDEDIT